MKSNRQNMPSNKAKRTVNPHNKEVKSFLDKYEELIRRGVSYSIFPLKGQKIMQIVVNGGSEFEDVRKDLESLPEINIKMGCS